MRNTAAAEYGVWGDDRVIREEIFGVERFSQHAKSLALSQKISGRTERVLPLIVRLEQNANYLADSYRTLAQCAANGENLSPAGEWLLNNSHVIEDLVSNVREQLSPNFYTQLPKLSSGPFRGYPRIFETAWAFVAHSDSRLDLPHLEQFVTAYQTIQKLTIGELWALPISLNIVLVENLRRAAARVATGRQQRLEGSNWVRQLRSDQDAPPPRLNEADGSIRHSLVVELISKMSTLSDVDATIVTHISGALNELPIAAEQLLADGNEAIAANNVTVRHIIGSMRLMPNADWASIVERLSPVDAILKSDPTYPLMDFDTRNAYRDAIEDLARRCSFTETEIAQKARELAAAHGDTETPQHVGFYLIGAGVEQLKSEARCVETWRDLPSRLARRSGLAGYAAAILSLTGVLLSVPLLAMSAAGAETTTIMLLAVLGILPACELATAFVNQAVTREIPPIIVPGLKLASGIPAHAKTCIVIPALIGSRRAVDDLIDSLERHHLTTQDPNAYYALLTDWTDADTQHRPDDADILAYTRARIAGLNAHHGLCSAGFDRFHSLHRARQWSESEQRWMGWERKRGKLHEFNRFLRGATNTSFLNARLYKALPSDIRYVITLDADTQLPRDAARRLVGKMLHPLNQPVHCSTSRRVIRGHGILQPRITASLPACAPPSYFQVLFSTPGGIDPYAGAISDVYQDLFDEGSFTGKGIYDVDAFETAVQGRFADGTTLSHDLIEGIFARAALATDVEFVEDFPSHYDVSRSRDHRWARGDWQLLPWLFNRADKKSASGDRHAHAVPALGRWKLADNLRRTLTPIATVLALVAGWLLVWPINGVWTLFIASTIAIPTYLASIAEIGTRDKTSTLKSQLARKARKALHATAQSLLQITFLVDRAVSMSDAILRTLYRLTLSRRSLLEWTTAAQALAASAQTRSGYARRLFGGSIIALIALAAVAIVAPLSLNIALPFILVWVFSPLAAYWVSFSTPAPKDDALTLSEQAQLKQIAFETWRYFDEFVTTADNNLPPDNFQESPKPVVAHRTSPTNIGLYLLSVVSARDFAWISTEQALFRMEQTVATLQRLETYRGHLFNWYDTQTLRVLPPRYISTVDSGNLAGHLVAVAQACRLWAKEPSLHHRLITLADTIDTFSDAMDFSFLVNDERQLLSIGFATESGRLDESCYDLLASEARLASLVAIGQGDIATKHWFQLGRALLPVNGLPVLTSWTGSMFEYLMPELVLMTPSTSLIGSSNRVAVDTQIQFGQSKRLPWGVSESAYAARDTELTYQYSSFGLQQLGLKRGLSNDYVIAPYATALAAMVRPIAAARNFAALEQLGARGKFGFYDACDFTAGRLPRGQTCEFVRNYMAHHQGMTIVALANVLLDQRIAHYFHDSRLGRSVELLLQEKEPDAVPKRAPRAALYGAPMEELHTDLPSMPYAANAYASPPDCNILANGELSVLTTAAGSGYIAWQGYAITRWLGDRTTDSSGSYIYVRDRNSGDFWSIGAQPCLTAHDFYEAQFSEERTQIISLKNGLETKLEIVVSSEDDAVCRRVTIKNVTNKPRDFDITSYDELALAEAAIDSGHPAFSKLFVETSFDKASNTLFASRRQRGLTEKPVVAAAFVSTRQTQTPVEFETDRMRFIGRGRSLSSPRAVISNVSLSGTQGCVLDPVFALRQRLRLRPGESTILEFWLIVGTDKAQLSEHVIKYRQSAAFQRLALRAWTQAAVKHRHLAITADDARSFQKLCGHLLYPASRKSGPTSTVSAIEHRYAAVWAAGISGDLPICLLLINDVDHIAAARQVLHAFEYWRSKGIEADLVILNTHGASYQQDLQHRLEAMVHATSLRHRLIHDERRGRIFIVRSDVISAQTNAALRAAARVTLDARHGEIEAMLPAPQTAPPAARSQRDVQAAWGGYVATEPNLASWNGLGGFSENGREYKIVLSGNKTTPQPWVNVIANSSFGFQVSAEGSGYAWSINSRERQLTPWSNDPVINRPGEVIYIADAETDELWTPTSAPIRDFASPYVVTHGQGYSTFAHTRSQIASTLEMFVDPQHPIKFCRLTLHNQSARHRRLVVTHYVEWVLGRNRQRTAAEVETSFDAEYRAIRAQNRWHPFFPNRVAFAACLAPLSGWSCDRQHFIGRNGNLANPNGLAANATLDATKDPTNDPCSVLQTALALGPNAQQTITFFLGDAEDANAATALLEKIDQSFVDAARLGVDTLWNTTLSTTQISTPDKALNTLFNSWLPYQTLSSRLWGRSGFYQAGGAFGFRDQLQDTLSILLSRPDLAREQILRAARHQFKEGDVLHWWLEPSGHGIRTRISDSLLWLPYVVSRYVETTGDAALLDSHEAFIEGRQLADNEHEVYMLPTESSDSGSIYEHCIRALSRAGQRGAHGLALIGSGDWNDGMNLVGHQGRGESVWLTWFLITCLDDFVAIGASRGDHENVDRWVTLREELASAVEAAGWDGEWYRRATFDDGTWLGSRNSDECKIDAIAQSWSVISGAGDPERARTAMSSVSRHLIDREAKLSMLFKPPFNATPLSPGYIKGYPPGIRENGGQYTHAAAWNIVAFCKLGDGDAAGELLTLINPINHTATPQGVTTYRGEPYVIAADVYSVEPHRGRAGWTWYTGSAGWIYRATLEHLLGLQRRGDQLNINPTIPRDWPEFSANLNFEGCSIRIVVSNPTKMSRGVTACVVDGNDIAVSPDGIASVNISRPGDYEIRVTLGELGVSRSTGPVPSKRDATIGIEIATEASADSKRLTAPS